MNQAETSRPEASQAAYAQDCEYSCVYLRINTDSEAASLSNRPCDSANAVMVG